MRRREAEGGRRAKDDTKGLDLQTGKTVVPWADGGECAAFLAEPSPVPHAITDVRCLVKLSPGLVT